MSPSRRLSTLFEPYHTSALSNSLLKMASSVSKTDRTDEELDRDWVPNGRRPQSTVARSFSAELMDIFRIENSVADLDEQIDKRKQQVNTGQTELQALEARLREMEERLQSKAGGQRQGHASTLSSTAQPSEAQKTSRPGTAKQAQHAPMHGGAMPPTPTASEDGEDRDS